MRAARAWCCVSASAILVVSMLAFPPPAAARVTAVTMLGDAVVGLPLIAVVTANEPVLEIEYQWLRCAADSPDQCNQIDGATIAAYLVSDADVGYRLAVRATPVKPPGEAKQPPPTAVVAGWPTLPPGFDRSSVPTSPTASPQSPAARVVPRYMRPCPVIRIKGFLVPGGARVTLLRVSAPRGSEVVVRCKGSGCPLRRRSVGVGRIRGLERFLHAGTRIMIRVSRPGFVGKYVRIVIRDGIAPTRRDACLLPGRAKPASCPPL